MIKRVAILSILLPLVLTTEVIAQKNDSFALKIKRVTDAYANLGRFSGSILVAQNGRIVIAREYGMANIELRVPNARNTKFDLGSLSKQFTAAAILKLESQGKLSVNDSIVTHLPDYPRPQGELVTIHHLLTHTSGIPSLGQRGGIPDPPNRSNSVTLDQLIALFKDLPLQFKPGEKYRYNNSGYIVLAAIIERVSGLKYDAYLKENIFGPAGMRKTSRVPSAPNVATGYMGYAPEFKRPSFVHPSWAIGAGGIHSTVEDLFRWDKSLYEARILSPSQTDKFFKAHVSRGRPGRDYGYGWFIDDVHGHRAINHGGTTEGFVSAYYRFPKERLFIVVLSNYMPRLGIDIPDKIADSIAAEVFGEKYELPPEVIRTSESELRSFVGEYEFEPGYKLRTDFRNGHLISTTQDTDWTLPTYSSLVKLDKRTPKIEKAGKIVRAFIEGDHDSISELAAPARRSEITKEAVLSVKKELAEKWGSLVQIVPFAVTKDGSVRHRVRFSKGDMFMMIEFNERDEFVGWFYGNRMMPSEVRLIPVSLGERGDTSRARFYADGFPYDEGAPWGEKPVFLEFVMEGGKVTGVVIKQVDEHRGRRIPI